ncbi:plasma membrane localization protein [Tilletia horrida]|nr:plasma membrane localization protein [Tilletia horrida]KAK0560223.1 plasma membrane localization protein [Tilletia horrida]
MCIPKAQAIKDPKKLLNSCYPPPKTIASTAPEYRPSGNELSRLAYFASNNPTQLTTVGDLLVQRANLEAKAFKAANGPKRDAAKAGLMLTLGITKNLISECKRELNYFNPHAQSIITIALDASTSNPIGNTKRDIEISARAASTFYALATFSQAAGSSVDANVGKTYLELVGAFSSMAEERDGDSEDTNRIRLIAIGALSGAVSSDVFFGKTYSDQAPKIIPALLATILPSASVSVSYLQSESAKVGSGGTPQYSEFISVKRQPIQNRRAPSLSGHVDGEKGPTTEDIASAAMATLRNIMAHGNSSSAISAVDITLAWLDGRKAGSNTRTSGSYWDKTEWTAWLSASLSNWSALPYRFVVLTHIVEHLVENSDGEPSAQQRSLIAMATSILNSKDSLIGLNTAETVNNLLGLIVRRVHYNTKDALVAPLVESVSSLGAHVYYADQIQDIAEEITARLVALSVPTANAAAAAAANGAADAAARQIARKPAKTSTPVERDESMRALLTALIGVIKAAAQPVPAPAVNDTKRQSTFGRATSRNRISPGVFHQTTALLTFPNPALRLTYEQALLTFVTDELEPAVSGSGALFSGANDGGAGKADPDAITLAHSLAAGVYTLLLAKALFVPTSVRDSPLESLVAVDATNTDESRGLQANPDAAALPTDYAAVAELLETFVDRLPVPATLAFVPMLATLDRNVSSRLEPARKNAARAVLARVYGKIGKTWEISSLESLSKSVSSSALTTVPAASAVFSPPRTPAGFAIGGGFTETLKNSAFANISSLASDLSKSAALQSASQADEKSLASWFGRDWSVGGAVSDSFQAAAPGQRRPTRMERRASIGSMSNSRSKLHASHTADGSIGHDSPGDRQVGVDDFREALNATNGAAAGGSGPNGTLKRSSSRRFSKRLEDTATDGASSIGHGSLQTAPSSPVGNGSVPHDVATILDRMHVGVPDGTSGKGSKQSSIPPSSSTAAVA